MSIEFKNTLPFVTRKKKTHVAVTLVPHKKHAAWIKKQSADKQALAKQSGFDGKSNTTLPLRNAKSEITQIIVSYKDGAGIYDFASLAKSVAGCLPPSALDSTTFELQSSQATKAETENFTLGWGLNAYKFDTYKSKNSGAPANMLWPKGADKKAIEAELQAIFTLRNLVNTPANDLGPDELEKTIKAMGKTFEGKVNVVKDKALIEKNFPLIYTVGKASPRRPRLIELNWGNTKHPKVTLVGKGVVFDTGGLDIKPSQYMRYMKKDMGGAAHTIALAYMIMAAKLPVRLQLLVPAVENAVAGEAFRPGDIIKSRKGLFVENTNTDAEGRLILADALTYASEKDPDLIIDFATLTGSARAALGPDIPAFFSNDAKNASTLQALSAPAEDPLWNMPLWEAYNKYVEASEGDVVNSAGLPGDLIYSALFLQKFLVQDKKGNAPNWMHLDCYAWEHSGKAGRPRGAADTGLRSVFKFLQSKYGA